MSTRFIRKYRDICNIDCQKVTTAVGSFPSSTVQIIIFDCQKGVFIVQDNKQTNKRLDLAQNGKNIDTIETLIPGRRHHFHTSRDTRKPAIKTNRAVAR